ncbi:hypothetical protein BDY19DRAFT_1047256 [Irpex rosettiformis]|uniref:Uncharacterized protein n=1 Tax=Irpex rosettiformis TaxID=378272 RepID=A0ACB8U9G7_9APHY|nr:hypothetical protein BDY19DRAFT_1047256 [Irpex rosettiformis]
MQYEREIHEKTTSQTCLPVGIGILEDQAVVAFPWAVILNPSEMIDLPTRRHCAIRATAGWEWKSLGSITASRLQQFRVDDKHTSPGQQPRWSVVRRFPSAPATHDSYQIEITHGSVFVAPNRPLPAPKLPQVPQIAWRRFHRRVVSDDSSLDVPLSVA